MKEKSSANISITGEFSKFFSAVFRIILLITAFFLLYVSACSFFDIMDAPFKTEHPALILIPGTLLLIAFLSSVYFISKKISDKAVTAATAAILGVFSLICFAFLFNFRVFNHHDYSNIRAIISDRLSSGEWDPYYVSKYPNNLPLLAMMLPVNRLADLLGMDRLFAEGLVNTLCIIGTAVFTTFASGKMFNKRAGLIASVLFLITIVLYPWTSNIYSDCPSMMLMMLGVYLFQHGLGAGKKSAKIIFCGCSGAAFAAAGWIRITAAFFLIGIAAYLICCKQRKNHISAAVSAIMSFAAVFALLTCAGNSLIPDSYDSESRRIPTVHWVMMGLNPETNGYYNVDDVKYTESFPGYEEKTAGDIKMLKERLSAHDPISLTKFCLKKMQIMWSGGHHNIKNQAKQATDYGGLYQYTVGSKDDFFVYFNQISWSSLLILSLASVISALLRRRHGLEAAIQIGLFGFFLFYLMWETNRRYSFFCIPVMITLSSGAVHSIYTLVQKNITAREGSRKKAFIISYAAIGAAFLVGITASFGIKWNHYTRENIRFNKTVFLQRAGGNKFELGAGDVYTETFPVKQGFNRISLMFSGDNEKAAGEYRISGETDGGEIIFERSCTASELLKRKKYSFDTGSFTPDGKEYVTVKVECISSGEEPVSLRGETHYPCNDTKFYKNNKLQPNASMMLNVTARADERFMSPVLYLTVMAGYLIIWTAAFGVPVLLFYKRRYR
ncbi:MAG: glycosyltransferase family 39 protein [Alistipes sp.]|nr:glycosyltransferase family 39 protein [Alistipes sp.]